MEIKSNWLLKIVKRFMRISYINRIAGKYMVVCIKTMRPLTFYLKPRKMEEAFDREYIQNYVESCRKIISPGSDVLEFAGQMTYAKDLKISNATIYMGAYSGERHIKKECDLYFDLADVETLPAKKFDCIICTQVLGYFIEPVCILRNLKRMLKEGGVLILTASGPAHMDMGEKYVTFYSMHGLKQLCQKVFGMENVCNIKGYGDLERAICGLTGMRNLTGGGQNVGVTQKTGISVITGACCYKRSTVEKN